MWVPLYIWRMTEMAAKLPITWLFWHESLLSWISPQLYCCKLLHNSGSIERLKKKRKKRPCMNSNILPVIKNQTKPSNKWKHPNKKSRDHGNFRLLIYFSYYVRLFCKANLHLVLLHIWIQLLGILVNNFFGNKCSLSS